MQMRMQWVTVRCGWRNAKDTLHRWPLSLPASSSLVLVSRFLVLHVPTKQQSKRTQSLQTAHAVAGSAIACHREG